AGGLRLCFGLTGGARLRLGFARRLSLFLLCLLGRRALRLSGGSGRAGGFLSGWRWSVLRPGSGLERRLRHRSGRRSGRRLAGALGSLRRLFPASAAGALLALAGFALGPRLDFPG